MISAGFYCGRALTYECCVLSPCKHRSECVYKKFNLFFSVVAVWGSPGEIESIG